MEAQGAPTAEDSPATDRPFEREDQIEPDQDEQRLGQRAASSSGRLATFSAKR